MPRESKAKRRQRIAEITAALQKTYPNAKCALVHANPLELLVATILSAQCRDERVNSVTRGLFKKYPSAQAYAAASPEQFERDIQSIGLYRNKTKSILAAAKRIVTDFGGDVPRTMAELLTLAGVARKTANVVLGTAFGVSEGIVVDTHVIRLTRRLGLTRQTLAAKIEADLMPLVPQEKWGLFAHLLIFHGRNCCTARKPDCPNCPVSRQCPSAFTFDGPSKTRSMGN